MVKSESDIIFLGTDFKKGKGGIASVLREYEKIFPDAKFISTTASKGGFQNLLMLFKALFCLINSLLINHRKIVHVHGASFNSFYRKYLFIKLSKLMRAKVVYHIHGGQFKYFYESSNGVSRRLISDAIKSADCIICLSDKWKQFFVDQFSAKIVFVIPNIVPRVEPKTEAKATEPNFPLNFLFLGDISEQKGVWWLLDTIDENYKKWKGKIYISLAGAGEAELLQKRIKEKELSNIIKFAGWISGEEKKKMLENSDAFILPSYNEGLPISILEAMSFGLPIISTTVGGIPDIIENYHNGILIEPRNKLELSKAIDFAINEFETFQQFGENNLKEIAPHFPEFVKKDLTDLYTSL